MARAPDAPAGHAPSPGRPAAFLDRDGVLNVDHHHTHRPEDLRFTPTAVGAVRMLNEANYLTIVVTNQSGVARGLYGEADVEYFHRHLNEELLARGARIDAFYYSPYHPDGTVARFAREHDSRKPNPGMIRDAMRDLGIRLSGSFLIGDRQSDMEAADRVGLPAYRMTSNTGDLGEIVARALAIHDPRVTDRA